VGGAIRRIAASAVDRNVAIASHGNALALFLHSLDAGVDFAFWARMSTPDIYVIEAGGDAAWSYHRLWKA
jgi:broad specificity phosphatase PhoE